MKALLLKGPGEILIEEIPVPNISDDEVLVETKYCGICGTDVHSVPKADKMQSGTYLGHEFSGLVAAVGKRVKNWKPGDRVVVNPAYSCGVCNACKQGRMSLCDQIAFIGGTPGIDHAGAFAQYVRVSAPDRRLHLLPSNVSFEAGALVEPLACSLHAVRMSNFKMGERAVVLGTGPIGLGVIAFLKHAGASLIIATETKKRRREVAIKLGADHVFNPRMIRDLKDRVLDITGGHGVDTVFDCSGVAQAFRSATTFLKRGGQILVKGIITKDVPINPFDFAMNEWRLQGSWAYYFGEFPLVVEFLGKKISPVEEMITRKIKLIEVIRHGFNILASPTNQEIKIIVTPGG